MNLLRLMVLFASLALLRAASLPSTSRRKRDADIENYVNERDDNGGYHFRYRTSDGTFREETGRIKDPGTDHEVLEVTGSVSWFAPDGKEYSFNYISDENGYRPIGEHLPQVTSTESKDLSEIALKLMPESISLIPDLVIKTELSESTILSLLGG